MKGCVPEKGSVKIKNNAVKAHLAIILVCKYGNLKSIFPRVLSGLKKYQYGNFFKKNLFSLHINALKN
jgi:hypothetical protein